MLLQNSRVQYRWKMYGSAEEQIVGGSGHFLVRSKICLPLNEEFEGSSEEMYEYVKNTIKKIAYEALRLKI
jgi:hypothetical protein